MERRATEIVSTSLKRKLVSENRELRFSVVDEFEGVSFSEQTSSASVRCLSSTANMGRWVDTIGDGEMQVRQQELADFLFTSGLPFSLVDNPAFRKWVQHLRPAFEIPHRKEVAPTMLNDSYDRMKGKMILKTQAESNMTLVTDSWTNIRGEAIVNYSLTQEAIYRRKSLMFSKMSVQNDIIALCSDTASNVQNAIKIVTAKYPHMLGIGCASHQFNLIIKNILSIDTLKCILDEAVEMSKWFRNHLSPLENLKLKQKELLGQEISLALPNNTRWQSNHQCVSALLRSKSIGDCCRGARG
ncbi:hypothetical protein V1523DRAFT_446203 [Lipomyces doorenjongii]